MRRLCTTLMLAILVTAAAMAQGIPYLQIYSNEDYHAHPFNFDLDKWQKGTVFFANFEGLLYYDNAHWRTIHTPNITRITVVYTDSHQKLWAGGYNFIGYVGIKPNGEPELRSAGKIQGEVQDIWEDHGVLKFFVNDGRLYKYQNGKISVEKVITDRHINIGLTDVMDIDLLEEKDTAVVLSDVIDTEPLSYGLKAVTHKNHGITMEDDKGKALLTITNENGIPLSDTYICSYNGQGRIFATSSNGLFAMDFPSVYSRFTEHEGLQEEILSITKFNGHIYAGTISGVFVNEGFTFRDIGIGSAACWQMIATDDALYLGTATGVFRVSRNGHVEQLTNNGVIGIYKLGDDIVCGDMSGLYIYRHATKAYERISDIEKMSKFVMDRMGSLWMQNIYGEICHMTKQDLRPQRYSTRRGEQISATIVELSTGTIIIDAETTKPFPYSHFSYLDHKGVTWLTDNEGKNLYRWKKGKRLTDMDDLLYPLRDYKIRAMYVEDEVVWIGTDYGIITIRTNKKMPALEHAPEVFIRTAMLGLDHVLWGGFGQMPEKLPDLDPNDRQITFTFSVSHPLTMGQEVYRYKLNDSRWTQWKVDKEVRFPKLAPGKYIFKVQARDIFGRESNIEQIEFYIKPPLLLRWWMLIIYLILLGVIVWLLMKLRLRKLTKSKEQLEKVVQERTAEIVHQRDEIEEKSNSLEQALTDLHSAQDKLIHQEKMATVGKLTQGLIDRILNPLNYINNFSKLSEGLVKDVEANIEDEKEHMSEENYEDTMDVLGMLKGNLQKVGEHGLNTARTLKAMEEMLKDRSGGVVKTNLMTIIEQSHQMLDNYYGKMIAKYGAKVTYDVTSEPLMAMVNPELMSRVLMSMLGNSMYAIEKKALRTAYNPELSLKAELADGHIAIAIRDNGIGIEPTIINKIFDPFFTTKTTGEASGIGLYLSHDIVHNYGGDIKVDSVKDEYTTFTIILPESKD